MYAEFDVDFPFAFFRPGIRFLGKVGPKNLNCVNYTNLNIQNSMVMFIFSVFD